MRLKESDRINDFETAMYIDLNWFDIRPEVQEEIIEHINQEMGSENSFSFPNIEVRLLVSKPK